MPNGHSPALYISVRDLADEWRVARSTVRRSLRRGGVRAVRLGTGRNGSLRYDRVEIDRWLDQQRERS